MRYVPPIAFNLLVVAPFLLDAETLTHLTVKPSGSHLVSDGIVGDGNFSSKLMRREISTSTLTSSNQEADNNSLSPAPVGRLRTHLDHFTKADLLETEETDVYLSDEHRHLDIALSRKSPPPTRRRRAPIRRRRTPRPTPPPTRQPTSRPTPLPTPAPTPTPTASPTFEPTAEPTNEPTNATADPTLDPTPEPTTNPTSQPTDVEREIQGQEVVPLAAKGSADRELKEAPTDESDDSKDVIEKDVGQSKAPAPPVPEPASIEAESVEKTADGKGLGIFGGTIMVILLVGGVAGYVHLQKKEHAESEAALDEEDNEEHNWHEEDEDDEYADYSLDDLKSIAVSKGATNSEIRCKNTAELKELLRSLDE